MLQFTDLLSVYDTALYLLRYLSLKDIFVLRCVNRELLGLVDEFLIPNLRVLNLSRIHATDVLLHCLLPKCQRLRVIKLSNCLPIVDEQLAMLLQTNQKFLREIHISNLHGQEIPLTSTSLQPILLDKCRRLHTLRITNCNWLSDGSLECFLLHLNLNSFSEAKEHSLRVLDLSGCHQISSRVLNLFVKSQCLHLTTLNLSYMTAVQDETLILIARNNIGQTIRHLNLINCKNVTDKGLRSLRSCPNLESLLCRGMNLDLVKSAVTSFPNTVYIDILRRCLVAMERANN